MHSTGADAARTHARTRTDTYRTLWCEVSVRRNCNERALVRMRMPIPVFGVPGSINQTIKALVGVGVESFYNARVLLGSGSGALRPTSRSAQ